jgi:signal transduction histidine kinase
MLHEFIAINRDEIIRRCRAKVATRSVPPPTDAEMHHGVPVFLDQLADALRGQLNANSEIERSALHLGHERLLEGFTVAQVVHDYGDVCQAITEVAVEMHAPISTDDFRMLNRCLDDAIAGAVTEFGRQQNQSTLESETARGNERAGLFAHEVRNLLNTAILAFEVLKTGNVGVGGSTGTVLHRSLMGARALTGRSLAELRLTHGAQNPEQFLVAGFIDELSLAASMEGKARGIRLRVMPVDDGVTIEADRQVLTAALMNLLQNAFKFTRADTTVVLRVIASSDRVLIEVEDECGGLPPGNISELFRPFEQRGTDRTGLGLGLVVSREGVEANNGRISARSLPNKGCVFTVDLPRIAVPVKTTRERRELAAASTQNQTV